MFGSRKFWHFATLVFSCILAVTLYFGHERGFITQGVIYSAITLVVGWLLGKLPVSEKHSHKVFLLLSIVVSAMIIWLYPKVFVDDAGFVIRYLNSMAEGCFYCFNPSEGPVFGISSFSYGLTTLLLALPGILHPVQIIWLVSLIGLVWLLWSLLKIVHHYTENYAMTWVGFSMILACSSKFLASTHSGLETCWHLAIVFQGLLYFIQGRTKRMWLFFALSVISKLDAVPLVVACSLFHIWENRKAYFKQMDPWWTGMKWAGIPLMIFVGLTFVLFDGPLPHSAYAKVVTHAHLTHHWFPFFELFINKTPVLSLLITTVVLSIWHVMLTLKYDRFTWSDYAGMISFIATLILYYFYNPGERMLWYYAMPELLLYTQLAVSLVVIFKLILRNHEFMLAHAGKLAFIIASLAVLITGSSYTAGEKNWLDRYVPTVEGERMAIGEYIASMSQPTDTLLASHGYFGANFKGFVIDGSGLNSQLVTSYQKENKELIRTFMPQYFVGHGQAYIMAQMDLLEYELVDSWHAINRYEYSSWVLFKRGLAGQNYRVIRFNENEVSPAKMVYDYSGARGFIGDTVRLFMGTYPPQRKKCRMVFSLDNISRETQRVTVETKDTVMHWVVDPYDHKAPLNSMVKVDLPLAHLDSIVRIKADSVIVVDPVYTYHVSKAILP